MKEILIINGSGGVGKDTFVECLKEFTSVFHTSIVNQVKSIAKAIGWNGEKNENNRKFLSDLKVLIDEYNDGNYNNVAAIMRDFREGIIDSELLCIDMREGNQIERAKKEFGAKSVLVTRNTVKHITSNIADAGVFNVKYDYHIENNGTIEDLRNTAKDFLKKLDCINYEKIIYVSHPYQGKVDNLRKIEDIILHLIKKYPSNLFLSPVHSFGFEYKQLDYQDGLNECLWLLRQADEMWVFGDYQTSKGCNAEIEFCKSNNIPYKIKQQEEVF